MSNWYVPPCHEHNSFGLTVDERLGYFYSEPNVGIMTGFEDFGFKSDVVENDNIKQKNETEHYFEIQFDTRDPDEPMIIAALDTKVLFDTPFVLQEDLIQSCVDMRKNAHLMKEEEYSFCKDAIDIFHILNELDLDIEIHDTSSKVSIVKMKASQIKDYNDDIHAIPIIIQFITSSIGSAAKQQRVISALEANLIERPIPYIQEYRSASLSIDDDNHHDSNITKKQIKNWNKRNNIIKHNLQLVAKSKHLDCTIPGLRSHLHTIQEYFQDSKYRKSFYSPIIWFLNSHAHLKMIKSVIPLDVPWTWKKNDVVVLKDSNDIGMEHSLLNKELISSSSSIIHYENDLRHNNHDQIPTEIEDEKTGAHGIHNSNVSSASRNTQMNDNRNDEKNDFSNEARLQSLLQYKIIIIPSTNTLQSMHELKWALYSRSIVLMQPPTITTYVMEERLEPYVHYVPIEFEQKPMKDGMTFLDKEKQESEEYSKVYTKHVLEQIEWIIKNDAKARLIAEQGALFIHDLFFDDNAHIDNFSVQVEVLKRYSAFFVDSALP
jgi:hypothetical protein